MRLCDVFCFPSLFLSLRRNAKSLTAALRITVSILARVHPGRRSGAVFSLAPFVDGRVPGNYLRGVSTQELTAEAMALPLLARVSLAQALWESIEAGLADADEDSAVREAIRRDEELSSGSATGRTQDEAMQAARRSIGCGDLPSGPG